MAPQSLTDPERITRSETRIDDLQRDMEEIKRDVKSILRKFDEMSGGKKALLGLFSLVGILVGIIVGVIGMLASHHS